MRIFRSDDKNQKLGEDASSEKEDPSKKEAVIRNADFSEKIGDARLCEVDLRYKQLIDRYSLTKSTRNEKMCIVKYLRATPNFEFIEISVNGAEPEWAKPYPHSSCVDFECSNENYTVKFVYDDDKDFVTEKTPLDSEAAMRE